MKYLFVLLVLIAAMLAVFFSFTSSYMTCSDAESRVRMARLHLTQEVLRMGELLPGIAALYYRYGTNGPQVVTYAEQARAELERQRSPRIMARAHAALQRSMQEMTAAISRDPRARRHVKYRDLMEAFNDTTQRIAYLQQQYNDAVAIYNQLLDAPQPSFWRHLMGMTNAEPFLATGSASTAPAARNRESRSAR